MHARKQIVDPVTRLRSADGVASGKGPEEDVAGPLQHPAASQSENRRLGPGGPEATGLAQTCSIQVDVGQLDYLVQLMAEMRVAESLLRLENGQQEAGKVRADRQLAQLARLTKEVQRTAVALRMVPVRELLQHVARAIREEANKTGVSVALRLSGEDIRLDYHLIADLTEPVLAFARYMVGVAADNRAPLAPRGKVSLVRFHLSAEQTGGHVRIKLTRDRNSLDPPAAGAQTQQNGLAQSSVLPSKHEGEVSRQATCLSLAKQRIECMGGRIELSSRPGQGFGFAVRLPLSLMIAEGLVVAVGAQRYILPSGFVQELLRPAPETIVRGQDSNELAIVHGTPLPLVRLHQLLNVRPDGNQPGDAWLVVVVAETGRFCLMVERFVGKQEGFAKDLGRLFRGAPLLAGEATLEDGQLGLILDPEQLALAARRCC